MLGDKETAEHLWLNVDTMMIASGRESIVAPTERTMSIETKERAALPGEDRLEHPPIHPTSDGAAQFRISIETDLKTTTSEIENGASESSVECRLCRGVDDLSNLESPCACRGSLTYVHRTCLQRWCNRKGHTTCEICHRRYQNGYKTTMAGLARRHASVVCCVVLAIVLVAVGFVPICLGFLWPKNFEYFIGIGFMIILLGIMSLTSGALIYERND